MKKLIGILIFIILFLFSCEKIEETYCWKCETSFNGEIISTIGACGLTESEAMDFQMGIEAQASYMMGDLAKTICRKKSLVSE